MFEIYKDKSGKFRFRLKGKNGEIICSSQAYTLKSSCLKGESSLILNSRKKIDKFGLQLLAGFIFGIFIILLGYLL